MPATVRRLRRPGASARTAGRGACRTLAGVDALTRPKARTGSTVTPGSTAGAPHARSARVRAAETRIRWLAVLLDALIEIPGTGRRIGIGPVIGLIPWIGDLL